MKCHDKVAVDEQASIAKLLMLYRINSCNY
jgi:hypothetical protein